MTGRDAQSCWRVTGMGGICDGRAGHLPLHPLSLADGVRTRADEAIMRLTTSEFADGAAIPRRFTCDGEDVSPALAIENVPDGVVSLALVMDDPDAPRGTFVHWLIWNLPPDTRVLPEAVPPEKHVRSLGEANQGTTDFGRIGYGGPCPPRGTHTYRFLLYALDARLDVKAGARREALDGAMKPHIVAQAVLRGTYTR